MLKELFSKQKPLMVGGLVFLMGGFAMLALTLIDDTQILGINRWIKPLKFYFSISIFMWTIALYLNYLRDSHRFSQIVSWTMIAIFVIEMAAVTAQAFRGTTSHFNIATPLDRVIFATMGIAIALNTILVLALLVVYFKSHIEVSNTVLWGMRLGLLLFLAGSLQGGFMSAQLGHTVGAADGGPGLPLTNWSTVAGDLRVAHFLGLHSLQAIPLLAVALERIQVASPLLLTLGFAAIYIVFFVLLFVQALLGRPFITL